MFHYNYKYRYHFFPFSTVGLSTSYTLLTLNELLLVESKKLAVWLDIACLDYDPIT